MKPLRKPGWCLGLHTQHVRHCLFAFGHTVHTNCNATCPPLPLKYPSLFQDQLKSYLDSSSLVCSQNSYSKYGWNHKDQCLCLGNPLLFKLTDQSNLIKQVRGKNQKNKRISSVIQGFVNFMKDLNQDQRGFKNLSCFFLSLSFSFPPFVPYLYSFLTHVFSCGTS